MRGSISFAALALVVLAGCAQNPYKQFYQAFDIPLGQVQTSGDAPRVLQGSDVEADRVRAFEEGYIPIGRSSFSAGPVSADRAGDQAQTVGAALVLVYSKYRNTVNGAMPLTLPNTQTSYTNVSGMAGSRSFYGNGRTTTYGTSTTYIPYSVDRSDYLAIYFAKAGPTPLGVLVRDPKPDERRAIGTNAGVFIDAVRKGSPAFNADLFRGDVLLRIGDTNLVDAKDMANTAIRYQGQTVPLVVLRDGKRVEKEITLGRF